MSRVFLVNVGSNASHSFCSPIFEDRPFEFIPIPEDRELDPLYGVQYKHLKSFNFPENDLMKFVPEKFWNRTMHSDPEFDTFTYGDNCDVNPRASSLKTVERGDFLLFLSRLQSWRNNAFQNEFGFYFIGYLHVDQIVKSVDSRLNSITMERFAINAHVRRAMSELNLWDNFWLFGGSSWSKRFNKAVPVTRELCDQVFLTSTGLNWRWDKKRSDLQVIGSYTRTVRPVIDQSDHSHKSRSRILWNWINENCD